MILDHSLAGATTSCSLRRSVHLRDRRCAYSQSTSDDNLISIIDHLDDIRKIPLADVRNFCIIAHVVSVQPSSGMSIDMISNVSRHLTT